MAIWNVDAYTRHSSLVSKFCTQKILAVMPDSRVANLAENDDSLPTGSSLISPVSRVPRDQNQHSMGLTINSFSSSSSSSSSINGSQTMLYHYDVEM